VAGTDAEFTACLVHTCTIRRRTGSLDQWDKPLKGEAGFEVFAENRPCFVSNERATEVMGERAYDTVKQVQQVFFEPDEDLLETDRIECFDTNGLLLVADSVIGEFRNEQDALTGAAHHIEVDVYTYRPSTVDA
jgi:hypothetical protein